MTVVPVLATMNAVTSPTDIRFGPNTGPVRAPGRLSRWWSALRRRLPIDGDRERPAPLTSSAVLLLETMQMAARRGRPAWARHLLLVRVGSELQALERTRAAEAGLGRAAPVLALLDDALDHLDRTPPDLPAVGCSIEQVLDATHVVLRRWTGLLGRLPGAPDSDLPEVLDRHLEQQLRNAIVAGADWTPSGPAGVIDVQRLRMHPDASIGLALSGGGIRSASFAMGALESLAGAHLLPGFDVISSVSGGGYAASWLTTWAYRHRNGIVGVQNDLYQAAGTSVGPMRWVGRHCAYLAPRLNSPLSSDAWSLFVAYVSNWLPILALLTSASVALLLLPHVLVVSAGWIRQASDPHLRQFMLGLSIAAFVLFAALVRRLMIYHRVPGERSRPPRGLPELIFYGSLLVTLGLASASPLLWGATMEIGQRLLVLAARAWTAGNGSDAAAWAADNDDATAAFFGWTLALLLAAPLAHLLGLVLGHPRVQALADRMRGRVGLDMVAAGQLERVSAPPLRSVVGRVLTVLAAAALLTALVQQVMRAQGIGLAAEWLIALGPLVLVFILAVAELAGLMLVHRFQHERERAWAARVGGWMLAAAVAWTLLCALALGGLPLLGQLQRPQWAWAAGLAVVAVVLLAWRRFGLAVAACGVVVLLYALALVALLEPMLEHVAQRPAPGARLAWVWGLWTTALGVALLLALLANVNRFSLHALYKQGLVRTFLGASRLGRRNPDVAPPDPPPPAEQARQFTARRADAVTDIDEDDDPDLAWLQSRPERQLPILLLNAAINGRSPTDVEGRVPRQWPFTFGPYFCGSPATGVGYARTDDFHAGKRTAGGATRGGGRLPKSLSLGTAMAVSGAAMSPTSGRSTHPLRAFILGILNARLGLWIGNPQHPASVASESPPLAGLTVLREMLGVRAKFASWIHLSDGGHFENLGIYELVRRGCRRIVVVDASCDPQRDFADLANAIRRVRIDLGIRIYRIGSWDIHGPDGVQHGGAAPAGVADSWSDQGERASGRSQAQPRAWIWFEISYGPLLPRGRLLYVKPSVYRDQTLPVEVQNYWTGSPSFPHESTADQFFTEAQMEAYRLLGQACMDSAMAGMRSDHTRADPGYDEDPHGLTEVVKQAALRAAVAATAAPVQP